MPRGIGFQPMIQTNQRDGLRTIFRINRENILPCLRQGISSGAYLVSLNDLIAPA